MQVEFKGTFYITVRDYLYTLMFRFTLLLQLTENGTWFENGILPEKMEIDKSVRSAF